jgi:predicted nuclease of predicted toxin-antitoxin system
MAAPGLLFDEHVNVTACRQLKADGVDVVHALEVGLGSTPDPDILRWAVERDRIVVTRNYQDFAPLVQSLAGRGVPFPGVLFLSTSVRQNDVGAHVRAIRGWIASFEGGDTTVTGSFAWLF